MITGWCKRKLDGSIDARNGRFPFSSVSVSASVPRENKSQRGARQSSVFAQLIKVLVPGSDQIRCKIIMVDDNIAGQVILWPIIFFVRRRRRRRLFATQRKNKRFCVRDIFTEEKKPRSFFFNLVKELRLSDRDDYWNTITDFDQLS